MKKIVILFFAVIIAVVSSISAFAVSSPSADPQEDKYTIVGIIVQDKKEVADVSVSLDGGTAVKTDAKGAYRLENVTVGAHKLTIEKETLKGEINFTVTKGTETKLVKNADGSYTISVAQTVVTLDIPLSFDAQGKATILKVTPAGNTSPNSPITGDVFGYLVATLAVVSGAAVLTLSKKSYSL